MIIITFCNEEFHDRIDIGKELVNVKPFQPRPLQCYNCYGFGHPSCRCTKNKLCHVCTHPEHGLCDRPEVCVNCSENHSAKSKNCKIYRKEAAAVIKANEEHISVGFAKKLLSRASYSEVLKSAVSSGATSKSVKIPASETAQKVTHVISEPKPQRSPARKRLSSRDLGINSSSQVSSMETPQP